MKFLIKKGNHYHSNFWQRLNLFCFSKRLSYKVRFSDSCWYDKVNADSNDLNKLFGFGGRDHQVNSIRLCWRPDFLQKGVIQVYIYWYDDGARSRKWFCDVDTNKFYIFTIQKNVNGFRISMTGRDDYIEHSKPNPTWKRLWPYFGGNNTAPHDMIIELI